MHRSDACPLRKPSADLHERSKDGLRPRGWIRWYRDGDLVGRKISGNLKDRGTREEPGMACRWSGYLTSQLSPRSPRGAISEKTPRERETCGTREFPRGVRGPDRRKKPQLFADGSRRMHFTPSTTTCRPVPSCNSEQNRRWLLLDTVVHGNTRLIWSNGNVVILRGRGCSIFRRGRGIKGQTGGKKAGRDAAGRRGSV